MVPSTNFIALSNKIVPSKKVLFTQQKFTQKYSHLKYLTPLIQLEIFPVPPSADE